jgi:manganese/zinc/iron transport system permease protein
MAALGGAALLVALLFWKELRLLCFDPDFAATIGLPLRALEVLVTGLLVVAIAIGLQTVGVVLMSAMVVAPAAAARQWTDAFGRMMLLAAGFGALGGAAGAVVSAEAARMPTGPTIVVCLTAIVVVSLTLAPRRGLVWRRVRDRRRAAALRLGAVLAGLEQLARQHEGQEHVHPDAVVRLAVGADAGARLDELERRGWARRVPDEGWTLTDAGRAEARRRELAL